MKCAALSDTHGHHRAFSIPDADVFIYAGDFTESGSRDETADFLNWMQALPHQHKLLIAGNHDLGFERDPDSFESLLPPNINYLLDSAVQIANVVFYGTPWTPKFFDFAFMIPRGPQMDLVWDKIPATTDVLISHGPPATVLDTLSEGQAVGCEHLRRQVTQRVKPRIHLFGHIHECGGQCIKQGETDFYNVAMAVTEFEV